MHYPDKKLTDSDHCDLIFIPLMGNVDRVNAALEVFEILNNEEIFTKDEQSKIKQCQFVVADIISDGDEELLGKFLEKININTNFLIEYEKELVETSRKEGREEGSNDKCEEIAKNMKGKYSDEEISEVTGLSLKKVIAL